MFRRVMEVNVKGPMLMSRLVLPDMLARQHGHIINMASYQAIGPGPMASSSATSKAALLRFTDSISAEVIDRGVIVTAVSPGWVVTDMTRKVDHNQDGWSSSQARWNRRPDRRVKWARRRTRTESSSSAALRGPITMSTISRFSAPRICAATWVFGVGDVTMRYGGSTTKGRDVPPQQE